MSSTDEPHKKGRGPVPETPDTEPDGQAESQPAGSRPQEPAPERTQEPTEPDDPTAAPDMASDEKQEPSVEDLQEEIADLKDKLLRVAAEAENVRKRAEREKADAAKFGIGGFARDMMNVADNLQRALQSATEDLREAGSNFIAGIEMTERDLQSAFEKNGIVKIEPAPGEKFDHNRHQAMAEMPKRGLPKGSVAQVIRVGYALNERLLRAAEVIVAKDEAEAPPAEASSTDEPPAAPADPDGKTTNRTA